RRAKRGARGHFQPRGLSAAQRRDFVDLVAPATFSLIENPESMLEFLGKFRQAARKYNITLHLEKVAKLTADAVTVIIGAVHAAGEDCYVRGSVPEDPAILDVLAQSGFFTHVRSMRQIPPIKHGMTVKEQR